MRQFLRELASGSRRRHYRIIGMVYALLFCTSFGPWTGGGADDVFYYIYLSSPFFDGDLDPTNDYALSNNMFPAIHQVLFSFSERGYVKNLFATGTPLLWLPFFLPVRFAGLLASWLSGGGVGWVGDRFSAPYLVAVSLGSMVYGLLTVLLVYETARRFVRPRPALFAALGGVLGSQLLAYVFRYTAMSHAASGFAVALMLFTCVRYRAFGSMRDYLLIAAATALVVLVRWQDAVLGIIPAAFWLRAMVRRGGLHGMGRAAGRLLAAALAFAALFSLQSFYWLGTYGKFLTMPQGGGYMHWGAPQIAGTLFSGWYGLYYWNPILLVGTAGLVILALRRRDPVGLALLAAFAMAVYVNASVSDWWGGGSFGSRRFSGLVPVLTVGIAVAFGAMRWRRWLIPAAIAFAAVAWNVSVLSAHTRGIAQPFFVSDMLNQPLAVLESAPKWIATLPLGHGCMAWSLVESDTRLRGVIVTAAGLALILVACRMATRFSFRAIERRYRELGSVLLVTVVFVDVFYVTRALPASAEGLAIKNLWPSPHIPPNARQREDLDRWLPGWTGTPAAFLLAGQGLKDDELRGIMERVRVQLPRLWARWVIALPDGKLRREWEPEARQLLPKGEPGPVEHLWAKAWKARRKENRKKEAGLCRLLLWINPVHVPAHLRLAELEAGAGRQPAADAHSDFVRRLLEGRVSTFLANVRGMTYEKGPFYDCHFRNAARELAQLHASAGHLDALGELYRRLDAVGVLSKDEQIQLRLIDAVDAPESPDVLARLVSSNADPESFMRIAKLCVETTRPESALSVLEAGFTKFPESPHLEYWFGRTLEFARDDQRLVDRLLASSVNSIVFRRIGGSRLLSVNRDAEAERFLAPVAGDAGRDDAQVQFCYGLALFRLGRYADADAYLTRAAELEPGVTLHVAYRVRVAVKLGNNDLARKVIDDALQASGEKPDLVALRGELQIESP